MTEVNIFIAFVGGLVSFLAPCFLPIIPGFLAYLAGSSTADARPSRFRFFLNSLFFVLGFSLVFAASGVLLNTLLERVAYDVQIWLARIGGAVIIFFGLQLVGVLKFSFFERTHQIFAARRLSSSYLTSFLFGFAFAAGWTPCVSIALGAILGLAARAPGTAFWLLLSYSIGLGLPFLVVGIFADKAALLIRRYGRITKYVTILFGAVLITLGILIFTQELNRIANFELLNRWLLK
ncbi:MAG: cytochrome c-type bioproteinis protein [Parcubacteria group bacterium Gr01-1014_66]|nr:MAG: cytochrome c-type bioproteinis protein [Parcubacteria group bacterium Gr01-1014_66]